MGFLSNFLKGKAANKALRTIQREASKPQNQQKAREMLAKLRKR
jgi:hypothetical protein